MLAAHEEVIERRDRRVLPGLFRLLVAAGPIARPVQAGGPAQMECRGRLRMQADGLVEDPKTHGRVDELREEEQEVVAALGDLGLLGLLVRSRQGVGERPLGHRKPRVPRVDGEGLAGRIAELLDAITIIAFHAEPRGKKLGLAA